MAPVGGDDPYITWPPHPDPEVEQMFREANRRAGMTVAFKISIKATIIGRSIEAMADSVDAVAEHLDEIQQNTPAFLGFTLSADRKARTALFNMYVDEDDPE